MLRPFLTALLATLCLSAAGAADEPPLVTEGVVDAPVERVWEAFTTKKAIESWMVAHTEIDLRVGGSWKTHYRKEGRLGDDGSIEHTILAFDAPRMFAFRTVKWPRTFPFPNAMKNVWSVLYFEPAGPNKTRVVIRMLGYGADDESKQMRKFFEGGNAATLQELKKYLEQPKPAAPTGG